MTDRTNEYLSRWSEGDEVALRELVERDVQWVHRHVRRRIGPELRKKIESVDVVQEAMVEVLRYAPRFVAPDQQRFRGLMVRIVENVLRDHHQFFHARRRAMSQEASGADVLDLSGDSAERPDRAVESDDERRWLRLGLELLSPEDRRVVILRQWDELSFEDIGRELDVPANTARMRFSRAIGRLARKVAALRDGEFT